MQTESRAFELGKNRIEALSDGIFAIVMTLLILEIHVPPLSRPMRQTCRLRQRCGSCGRSLSRTLSVFSAWACTGSGTITCIMPSDAPTVYSCGSISCSLCSYRCCRSPRVF